MRPDCWLYLGEHNHLGYGRRDVGGKYQGAHRLSWQIHRGEIPVGLNVLHHYDRRDCIYPDHLYLGTQSDNNRDAYRRNRRKRPIGELNGRAKINRRIASEVRNRYASGEMQITLAGNYALSPQMISNICTNKNWRTHETTNEK